MSYIGKTLRESQNLARISKRYVRVVNINDINIMVLGDFKNDRDDIKIKVPFEVKKNNQHHLIESDWYNQYYQRALDESEVIK